MGKKLYTASLTQCRSCCDGRQERHHDPDLRDRGHDHGHRHGKSPQDLTMSVDEHNTTMALLTARPPATVLVGTYPTVTEGCEQELVTCPSIGLIELS